jgi:hypothetical protein
MANFEFRLDLPATSLEGNLHIGRQFHDMVGPDYIEGVDRALRFMPKQVLPVYNAGGRNYYIPLLDPIGPYDALQVAGGGNFDLGITSNEGVEDSIVSPEVYEQARIIVPPSEDSGLFTSYTMYYENGEYITKANINPIGSYTARSAARKITQTSEAFELLPAQKAGVITPKYVGKFEYEIADQFGEPQTAILMMVPSLGRRFDSTLLLPLRVLLEGNAPPLGKEFADELEPFYKGSIVPRLFSIGQGIAAVHRAGLSHHQLTPGNVDTLHLSENAQVPYITDWDTTTIPVDDDRLKAETLDVVLAIQSASTILTRLVRLEAISPDAAAGFALATALSLFQGYSTGKHSLPIEDISAEDAVNIAAGNYTTQKCVDLVESWLI